MNIHDLRWIWTRDPCNQAIAELRLRPRGHGVQLRGMILTREDEVFENISSVTLLKRNPSWIGLRSKPDTRHDRPGKDHVIRLYCESVIGIHWDLARSLEGIRKEVTVFKLGICLLGLKKKKASRYTGGVWTDMTCHHCVTHWINVHSLLYVWIPLAPVLKRTMYVAQGVCSYVHDHRNK